MIAVNLMAVLFLLTLYTLLIIFQDRITIDFYKDGLYINIYKTLIPWRYFEFSQKKGKNNSQQDKLIIYLKNPLPAGKDKIVVPLTQKLQEILATKNIRISY